MLNSIGQYFGGLVNQCCFSFTEEEETMHIFTNEQEMQVIEMEDKKDFISSLATELLINIFSYLDYRDLERCCNVSKRFCQIASDPELRKKAPLPLPKVAFGKELWKKYFDIDVGKEPTVPRNIYRILKKSCPYWFGKTVKQTHILFLMPKFINDEPLTLKNLENCVKESKKDCDVGFRYGEGVMEEYGDRTISESYWVLMTRGNIPFSEDKNFKSQQSLLTKKDKSAIILEAVICNIVNYVSNQELLFDYNYYTACEEKLNNFQVKVGNFSSTTIGGFSASYLRINNLANSIRGEFVGLAAVRRFGEEKKIVIRH